MDAIYGRLVRWQMRVNCLVNQVEIELELDLSRDETKPLPATFRFTGAQDLKVNGRHFGPSRVCIEAIADWQWDGLRFRVYDPEQEEVLCFVAATCERLGESGFGTA